MTERLTRKSLLWAAGFGLLVLSGLWCWELAPHWTQRLPRGWQYQSHYIGILTNPDPATRQFPEKDTTATYERAQEIVDESRRPQAVVIRDSYTTRDTVTDKIAFEYITQAEVDPRTGECVRPEFRGDCAVFPRWVGRRTYRLRANYLEGLSLSFEREERVEGLLTYVFSYTGRCEYTKCYAGNENYAGVKVAPGQEIRAADDQFSYRVWVEPVTGELIKVEEASPAGDYIFDTITGRKVAPVMRWGGETAGDDVLARIEVVRSERWRLLWIARYAPALMLALGLGAVGIGVMLPRNPPPLQKQVRKEDACRV